MRQILYRLACPLCAGILGLWVLAPAFLSGQLADTNEAYRHLVLAEAFTRALTLDRWYPRWLPEMNGGYGYPEFVFYQPAYFYLHAWLGPLTDAWLDRQLLTLGVIAFFGSLAVFLILRRWLSQGPSLLGVLIFQSAAYVRINLYVRGDLTEWMLLEWLPWSLLCLLEVIETGRDGPSFRHFCRLAFLSVAVAILCYCHPVGVIFLPGFLILFALGVGRRGVLSRLPLNILCAVLVGLALSAPYWASVALMKPWVLSEMSYAHWPKTHENASAVATLLWGGALLAGRFNEAEFIGLPFFLASLWGGFLSRSLPLFRSALGLYLLCFFLMTPIAAPFWRLPPFSLMQFPWRLAVFTPLLQAILISGIFRTQNVGLPWRFGHSVITLITGALLVSMAFVSPYQYRVWTALGPLDQRAFECFYDLSRVSAPATYLSTLDTGEWLPKSAPLAGHLASRQEARVTDAACTALGVAANQIVKALFGVDPLPQPVPSPRVELEGGEDFRVLSSDEQEGQDRFRLIVEGSSPGRIRINQFYLPGWEAEVDGNKATVLTPADHRASDGTFAIDVPAGRHRVEVQYRMPYDRPIGLMMVVVPLLALGLYGRWVFLRRGASLQREGGPVSR